AAAWLGLPPWWDRAYVGGNLALRIRSPIREPNTCSSLRKRLDRHGSTACDRRFTIKRTIRSTHRSTGNIGNGTERGCGQGWPLGPSTRCRKGVSTKLGETTPT